MYPFHPFAPLCAFIRRITEDCVTKWKSPGQILTNWERFTSIVSLLRHVMKHYLVEGSKTVTGVIDR
jgi:GH43 family beta-xylosidase